MVVCPNTCVFAKFQNPKGSFLETKKDNGKCCTHCSILKLLVHREYNNILICKSHRVNLHVSRARLPDEIERSRREWNL